MKKTPHYLKSLILLLTMSLSLPPTFSQKKEKEKALRDLTERIIPGRSKSFKFSLEPSDVPFFEIVQKGRKIGVNGDSPVSVASGLHYYLRNYCHSQISWCGDQLNILKSLPRVEKPIRISSSFDQGFYLNYCTFSYSMAFWDWDRWEREIDLMALHGITTPMAMVGAEVVWRNTLKRFGYSDKEIKEFLCGPAFLGWFLMGNLEKHGGPLPDWWFERQEVLQKKILGRMRDLGMEPLLQGFFGMVPNSMPAKYPQAKYIPQGKWGVFQRPTVLSPLDPFFKKMAKAWYEESDRLFGKACYYGGDLFHEGGHAGGIDVSLAAKSVQDAMRADNPDAVWVIQSWGANPRKDLLSKLEKENTLVVELCAEFWRKWEEKEGYWGKPWIWSHISNWGGNIGLHGRMEAIASEPFLAMKDEKAGEGLCGLGFTPEGIETNPVVLDLTYEVRWAKEPVNLEKYIRDYAFRRYGKADSNLEDAWAIFMNTAYGTYKGHRRPAESLFCARPSLKVTGASTWGSCKIYYDPFEYAKGVDLFLKGSEKYKDLETYQYDAVDMTRQFLANEGRLAYYSLVKAYQEGDREAFKEKSGRFVSLLKDQDRLLGTIPAFRMDTWEESAKKLGRNEQERDLFEYNARLQVTTWAEEESGVNDYAHKEWHGLLSSYYLPRWEQFFDYLKAQMRGEKASRPDYYSLSQRWVAGHKTNKNEKMEDPVKVAKELFEKYFVAQ